MDNDHMKKTKLKLIFWGLIILLALGSSVNVLVLGGTNTYKATNQTDITTVTSFLSLDPDDEESGFISILDSAKHSILGEIESNKNIDIKNIISISALVAILKGITINIHLILIFNIFYLNLFKSRPDDLNLVNQKVRLDD